MAKKIRVLVVDDSPYSRQTIKGMLETDGEIEIAGIATNGVEAMAKTLRLKPDMITLDFEMPEMDGFTFLRWLMKERPTPVIMVSSYSDKKTVFTALELGAADFIPKPSQRASADLLRIQDDLLEKVRGIRDLKTDNLGLYRDIVRQDLSASSVKDEPSRRTARFHDIDVVAIGASTGGPAAIQVILTSLPADFPAAILISQHMPKGFTGPFAERLNRLSMIRVKEAAEDVTVEKGTALICPGGCHMIVKEKNRDVRIMLKSSTAGDAYTPSVDVMMASAAERFGATTMGVVLTGMGKDGKKGVVEIKGKGGYTIAESEKTSVVFGMPQEAIKTGAVDRVLPLDEIPMEITRVVMSKEDATWKKNRG
ncbi:MAG TPA: chemotaxis response regulator protein-glutamate methylesterase [Thermodesulfovibrionales bacterium]|nr:chemotaxis response regulator protein-glutamate methylesterase [Thermodesulfovibrionales bacterium]